MTEKSVFARDLFFNTVTLVTGAASGIGRTVAETFASLGSTVILADYDTDLLQKVHSDMNVQGYKTEAYTVNVADSEQVHSLFTHVEKSYGKLDHCVTCAGVIGKTKLLDTTEQEWQRVIGVNLTGTFLCVQEAYRLMLPRQMGSIVAIASDTAKRGGGRIGTSAYGASKGGVLALVKSIAREMAGCGVRINTICPGPADTEMHNTLNDTLRQQAATTIPLGRFAKPNEIANAIVYLCSDAASYIYGESMNVDGGVIME